MSWAFIIDIDGTVALRNPEGQTVDPKGNDTYRGIHDYHRVSEDLPNNGVISVLKFLQDACRSHVFFVYVSGRPDSCREDTEKWLTDNGLVFDKLFMRQTGDYRKDFIVKQEIYDAMIQPQYKVLAVFDDRQQVVDMWRSNGLICLQVAPGDF